MNPFHKPTSDEQKKIKKAQEDLEIALQASREAAKAILASEYGSKYKDALTKARDSIIGFMMRTANPDPVQDAYFMRSCLAKLDVMYSLLTEVEKDARK